MERVAVFFDLEPLPHGNYRIDHQEEAVAPGAYVPVVMRAVDGEMGP